MGIPNLRAIRDWCLEKFQPKGSYAMVSDIPTKTSQLVNDNGFKTSDAITGVKGNAESEYRCGNVNLTAENVGALPITGTAKDSEKLQGYGITKTQSQIYGTIPIINPDGVMEVGKYIDFHLSGEEFKDYDLRINAKEDGLYLDGKKFLTGRTISENRVDVLYLENSSENAESVSLRFKIPGAENKYLMMTSFNDGIFEIYDSKYGASLLKATLDKIMWRSKILISEEFMNRFTLQNGKTQNIENTGINDVNNITCNSIYMAYSGSIANLPIEKTWFYVVTFIYSQADDYRKQFAFHLMSNSIYTRVYKKDTLWENWERIYPQQSDSTDSNGNAVGFIDFNETVNIIAEAKTTWKASKNCWMVGYLISVSASYTKVFLDGMPVAHVPGSSTNQQSTSFCIPVMKGQVVETGNSGTYNIVFYAMT